MGHTEYRRCSIEELTLEDSDLIAKVKVSIKNDKFPFQKLLCIIAPLETHGLGEGISTMMNLGG